MFVVNWSQHASGPIPNNKLGKSKQQNNRKHLDPDSEPDDQSICAIFGHLEQWKYAQEHRFFAKIESKFQLFLKNPSNKYFTKVAEFGQIWSHCRSTKRVHTNILSDIFAVKCIVPPPHTHPRFPQWLLMCRHCSCMELFSRRR